MRVNESRTVNGLPLSLHLVQKLDMLIMSISLALAKCNEVTISSEVRPTLRYGVGQPQWQGGHHRRSGRLLLRQRWTGPCHPRQRSTQLTQLQLQPRRADQFLVVPLRQAQVRVRLTNDGCACATR